MPPDNNETELGSSGQETSLSAGKNTGVVWKCVPSAFSGGVDIPEVSVCRFLRHISSQGRPQKLLQGLVSPELTAYLSVSELLLTQ